MPIIELTGTESLRIKEIQNRWIVSEPNSDSRLYQYPLYTVPLGQTFSSQVLMETGSFRFESGTLNIKKDIHVFEEENEASLFINEIGSENVSSISERVAVRPNGELYTITEVQLVNHPQLSFIFELIDGIKERGFKLEIFSSGSNGLNEIQKDPVFNARGEIISDTFLKYFEVETDD